MKPDHVIIKRTVTGWDLDIPNRNGRIYSQELVKYAIDQCQYLTLVTLDVPEGAEIDLARICGKVIGWKFEKDAIVAEIEISETPLGKILCSLLDAGVHLELVPSGTGTLGSDGQVSDYKLTCLSFVMPSASGFSPKFACASSFVNTESQPVVGNINEK